MIGRAGSDRAHEHESGRDALTRNQALVYDTLCGANCPMTAYSILDRLHESGLRAPPQVYRALDKLMALGMVHRLESINAFIACQRDDCSSHAARVFAICDQCGAVMELADNGLLNRLEAVARRSAFRPRRTTIELRGACGRCAAGEAKQG